MRILYVCTANICRSASAQQLLLGAVAGAPELAGIEVRSAGTAAIAGSPGCAMAPSLAGHAAEHQAQHLTAEVVAWADLILPAARDHRPAILELVPSSRSRTFTIRQAGRIADWIVDAGMVSAAREPGDRADRFPPGDPRIAVPDLPAEVARRWAWLVDEMDAARGMAPLLPVVESLPAETDPRRRLHLGRARRFAGRPRAGTGPGPGGAGPGVAGQSSASVGAVDPDQLHPDDIPDPHFLGSELHQLASEQIRASTDALVRLLREVASTE